jgi:type II secretory pathway component PulL
MALENQARGSVIAQRWALLRVIAIAAVVVVAMLLATAVFGWHGSPPPFDITIDPAGTMPF